MRNKKQVVGSQFTNKLTAAFRLMRKMGLIAKQNWKCCQTCGCYDITILAEKLKRGGKAPLGYAFYHNQDKDSMVKRGDFYIAYGGFNSQKYGKFGLDDKDVGGKIIYALTTFGLITKWDGNPNTRILVRVS
jgi:hypothetical protein